MSQFDFFSFPKIELCDIFSLHSPAKQQVLFVRHSFNLSSFRRFLSLRYITVHVRILLSFPYRFPREGSQRYVLIAFKYKLFALNVLLNLSIQFLLMRDKILQLTGARDLEIKSTYISTRTEHKLFSLQEGLKLEASLLLWIVV